MLSWCTDPFLPYSTPEPVDLESAEGTVKVRIFPPIAEGSETDAIIRSFNNSAVKEDTEDPFMVHFHFFENKYC